MTEATRLLEKAHKTLGSARVLLEADAAEDAINRAYYAAFHVATAALLQVGERPKTHKGTHGRFWIRFVEAGHVAPEQGEVLAYAWRVREKADYDAFADFETAAPADLLRDVEGFIQAVEPLVLP